MNRMAKLIIVALAFLIPNGAAWSGETVDATATLEPDAVATATVEEDEEESEREVTLADVPEAARKVILEEAGENAILEIDEIVVDGRVLYDAEWRVGDQEIEITVTSDGEIVGREIEDEDDAKSDELDDPR